MASDKLSPIMANQQSSVDKSKQEHPTDMTEQTASPEIVEQEASTAVTDHDSPITAEESSADVTETESTIATPELESSLKLSENTSSSTEQPRRSSILHIVRHGQAAHNVKEESRFELDPLLTETGQDQARALVSSFPYTNERKFKIFSSPLRRTIQTTLIGFSSLLPAATGQITCLAEAQEVGDEPCDTGLPLSSLAIYLSEQPGVGELVNVDRVVEGWDGKDGEWGPDPEVVAVRAQKLLRLLINETKEEEEEEKDVILVTHGYFIHFLIEDWDDFAVRGHDCGFRNCEFRSYEMVEKGEKIVLVETERSRALRNAPPVSVVGGATTK